MMSIRTLSTVLIGSPCCGRERVLIGIAALIMVFPDPAAAQTDVVAVRDVRPLVRDAPFHACVEQLREDDSFIARVADLISLPEKVNADRALRELEPELRQATEDEPEDLNARYRLAIVVGARSDLVGGRTRVRLANELYSLTTAILESNPDHAGAHYMLGRLHAGVMRLGRVQRFLARKLLGGAALKEASWDGAQSHLEAAEAGEPCIPDHHYELARVYLDRGEDDLARRELEHAIRLTAAAGERWARVGSRAAALQEEVSQK